MKKRRILFIVMFAVMGVISFINNSGYAQTIDSNNRTSYILLLLFIVSYTSVLTSRQFILVFLALAVFWGSPYFAGYGMDGFRFLPY